MKSYTTLLLVILSAALTGISCSGEDPAESPIPLYPEVQDTHRYLALRSDGKVFSIGNKSGVVNPEGQIPGVSFNTVFNTVTSSEAVTWFYEPRFDPPKGLLFSINRSTGASNMRELPFPEAFGSNPGLQALDWDESKQDLVGIVRQDMDLPQVNKPLQVVRIHPQTLEFTVLETLDLHAEGYVNVFSSALKDQLLYVSASKDDEFLNSDLLEVDLAAGTFRVMADGGIPTGLHNLGSLPGSAQLMAFTAQLNTGVTNAVRPYAYHTDTEQAAAWQGIPQFSALNFNHKLYSDAQTETYAALVASEGIRLLTYSPGPGKWELLPLVNSGELSSLVAIIDVVRL